MLCSIFRFLTTRSLDAGAKPGFVLRGHLRACQQCRRFYEVSKDIDGRLRQEAPGVDGTYQSYLTERTVSNLPSFPAQVTTGLSTTMKYLFPASAAAIVLLLIGSWYFLVPERPVEQLPAQSIAGLSVYDMLSVETLMAEETGEADVFGEWPNWMERPVRLEVEYLVRDAEVATGFLLACLDINTL